MSRILEALPFEFLQNIDWSEKRNKLASVLAGTLFFSGWWFALDASASHHEDTRDYFHLCGVFSTISMFMVNAVSNSLLRGEGFTEGCLGSLGARVWFFVGFMMGFGSFIGNSLRTNKALLMTCFKGVATFCLESMLTSETTVSTTFRRPILEWPFSCKISSFLPRASSTSSGGQRTCGAEDRDFVWCEIPPPYILNIQWTISLLYNDNNIHPSCLIVCIS